MAETAVTEKDVSISGDEMTIKFRLDPVGALSGSGKSMVVASTGGFIPVSSYQLSLNVIKKRR